MFNQALQKQTFQVYTLQEIVQMTFIVKLLLLLEQGCMAALDAERYLADQGIH